jgi:shikimate kinase
MSFEYLAKDTKFMDCQNAQIILVGAREGRGVIKNEIGIEIAESLQYRSADVFNKLSDKIQASTKPLMERKLEFEVRK